MAFEKNPPTIKKNKHHYLSLSDFLKMLPAQAFASQTYEIIFYHLCALFPEGAINVLPSAKIRLLGYSHQPADFFSPPCSSYTSETDLLNNFINYPLCMLNNLQTDLEEYINNKHNIKGNSGYYDFRRDPLLGTDFDTTSKNDEEILSQVKHFIGDKEEFCFFHLNLFYVINNPDRLTEGYCFDTQKKELIPFSEFKALNNQLTSLAETLTQEYGDWIFGNRSHPLTLIDMFSEVIEKIIKKYPLLATYHSFKFLLDKENHSFKIEEEGFLIQNNLPYPKGKISIEPAKTSPLYTYALYDVQNLLFSFENCLDFNKKTLEFLLIQDNLPPFHEALTFYKNNLPPSLERSEKIELMSQQISFFLKKYSELFYKFFGFFSEKLMSQTYSDLEKKIENEPFFTTFLTSLTKALRMSLNYLMFPPLNQGVLRELYQLGIQKIFLLKERLPQGEGHELKQANNYSPISLKPVFEKVYLYDNSETNERAPHLPSLFLYDTHQKLTLHSIYSIKDSSCHLQSKLEEIYIKISTHINQVTALYQTCLNYKITLEEKKDETYPTEIIKVEINLVKDLINILDSNKKLSKKLILFSEQVTLFQANLRKATQTIKKKYPQPILNEIILFFQPEPPNPSQQTFLNDCVEILNLVKIEHLKDPVTFDEKKVLKPKW